MYTTSNEQFIQFLNIFFFFLVNLQNLALYLMFLLCVYRAESSKDEEETRVAKHWVEVNIYMYLNVFIKLLATKGYNLLV